MGTAFDKVMENRKSLETAMLDSIRDNWMLFQYSSLDGVLSLPVNSAKNYTYQGVNAVRLMQKTMERGISDNRWLTFNQAKELGYHVKKGSSGVLCEQWEFDDKAYGATGMPKVSYYYVFNAADIEGMEPLVPEVPEVSDEYRNLIEQGIKDHTADMDDGLLINLINVFVKAKYGLLTSDYKDSAMHELSYIMKNVARVPNYVPATIKKAQDESNIISLQLEDALLTMVQNNDSVPIVEDIPEEIYEEDGDEPEEDIIEDFSERYEVTETSDAFETPYAVWDNVTQDYYVEDSWIPTFETKEEAAELCSKLNAAVEQNKEVTETPASAVTVMPDVAVTTENEAKEEPKNNDVSVVAEENGNYVFSFTEEPEVPMVIEMEPEEQEPTVKEKKTSKSKQKIEDFGKKIGGARKDMWASRGLNLSDLDGMNASEMEKYITKDNVWKKPDYDQLIADGLPVKVVWFMKCVRDKVPTKPNYSSYHSEEEKNAIREEYINFVGAMRDEVMACKTKEDCVGLYQSFFHDQGYVERTGSYSLSATDKCIHHLDNKLYKVFRDANYEWGYTYDRQIKKHQFGVDADQKLPKGYAIREYTNGTFSVVKGYTLVASNFDSWAAAKKYLDENVKSTTRKKAFTPPQLEHVRREGLTDIRNDNNITGDDFLADYGFYGGEFGNWMSEADRQASLNMGYEAFYDLAEALQITSSDISFNGKLSIAFGARGHGKAAAHYEPAREVINLTKMTGAGSLAHEWGHALDDYLGKKLGYGRMLTEARAPEIQAVMDAMRGRPATEEEKAEKYDKLLADRSATASMRCEDVINRYKEAAEASKTIALSEETQTRYKEVANKLDEILTTVTEKIVQKDYAPCLDLVEQAEALVRETNLCDGSLTRILSLKGDIIFVSDWTRARENYKVETDYYKGSKLMDGVSAKCDKGYWASNCEMFARAFSCYVMDKLKPGRSDYLCGHSESAATITDGKVVRAYPVGEDRTRINAAMDNFIQQMKEKELLSERSSFAQKKIL